jgi:hypothetical protein
MEVLVWTIAFVRQGEFKIKDYHDPDFDSVKNLIR